MVEINPEGLTKLSARERFVLMVASVKELAQEVSPNIPLKDKLAQITTDPSISGDQNAVHTRWRAANILESLKTNQVIADWAYCKGQSTPNLLQVNMIIVRKDGKMHALGVVASPKSGSEKRKRIKELFGSFAENVIPVLQLRTAKGHEIGDFELRSKLVSSLRSSRPIQV